MLSMKKSRKLGSQFPRQAIPAPRIASSSAPVALADGEPEGPEQGWAPLPSLPSTGWGKVETEPAKSGTAAPALSTCTVTVAPRATVGVTLPKDAGGAKAARLATAASATVASGLAKPRLTRR